MEGDDHTGGHSITIHASVRYFGNGWGGSEGHLESNKENQWGLYAKQSFKKNQFMEVGQVHGSYSQTMVYKLVYP